MREAVKKGYKVYLYFVCYGKSGDKHSRIKEVRVKQGGHDVPEDKIRARYIRSLDLLYAAAELVYQIYFFDNSTESDNKKAEYFAHFEKVRGRKVWDPIDPEEVPSWFVAYYLGKI